MKESRYPIEGGPGESLFKRISELKCALKYNYKICVYLYRSLDSSTFRYRVYNPSVFLEDSVKWRGFYFFENELNDLYIYIEKVSVVVICRMPWSSNLELFIRQVKKKKVPVAFDCDDLVFDVKKIPLVANTISTDVDSLLLYSAKLYMTATFADAFVTTNAYLANKLEEMFHKPVYLVSNSFNLEQEEASEHFVNERKTREDSGVFTIGYFSGTPTHKKDLQVCLPEISAFLRKYENCKFCIAGYMDLQNEVRDLLQNGKIEFLPFVDYISLQGLISNVDVNIAPLLLNEFTNCKSELKYFEAALVRVVTIASPSYVFSNAIKHLSTGFLCAQGEWYACLEFLYESKTTRDVVSQNAYNECIIKYGKRTVLSQIEYFLNSVKC